ncbi:hypothetical protein AB0E69_14455 [Kribbella sp. NPDC026611]|uniref:hypothetical protein n=1 Tax=Kribbella sp. NPDC026611 TaxID=3154911 RepID=UPI0033C9708C
MISLKPTRLLAAALAVGAAAATALAGVPAGATTDSGQAVPSTLKPGQRLLPGQSIKSPNGVYTLSMEKYGDAVMSKPGSSGYWGAGKTKAGSVLVFQPNGNLQVIWGRTVVWASDTAGNTGATLKLENTGRLVIYNARGKAAWNQSMVMVSLYDDDVLRTDLTLYSHNRLYRFQVQRNGDVQLLKGSALLWNTKTGDHVGAYVLWDASGSLCVLNADRQTIWSSKTARPGSVLQLRDDGNLVIVYGRSVVWQTGTAGR